MTLSTGKANTDQRANKTEKNQTNPHQISVPQDQSQSRDGQESNERKRILANRSAKRKSRKKVKLLIDIRKLKIKNV